ncbi:MAG: hypothetical protein QUS66_13560, partial [Bacteroidota bacterium]|nr:hypothetical protein [Bacteroidota bacterium]
MKAKLLILILSLASLSAAMNAQVVTANPVFPVASGPVVITFYADHGNMALKDYAGDVYAHTGVITSASTGPTDWKYVIAGWAVNTPKAKLTKISANVYTLTISPSIREFYGVPAGEQIQKLAFVFRNSDGSIVGRDVVGNGDIFYNVSEEAAFDLLLSQPSLYTSLVNAGQEIPVEASASVCDSIILYQNGTQLKKVTSTTLTHTVTAAGSGSYKLL